MQRYFAKEKKDDIFILDSSDLYHIKTVMRMNNNDLIEVVYQGVVYLCHLNIQDKIEIIIDKVLEQRQDKSPEITLILPYLKEQKVDLILQKGTELGIKRFIFTEMERSIVKIEDKKETSKIERWSRICKEASEQSMRLDIPIVEIIKDKSTLEKLDGLKLLCSTQEHEKTVKNFLKKEMKCDKINLMIGPEGGISPKEESYYEQHGFIRVSLGNQVMRVETVPIFLASIIRYEYME